jgi:Divergent InlB B-repeat domain
MTSLGAAVVGAAVVGTAFAGPAQQTLTVAREGTGAGAVASDFQPGIDCGPTCAWDFPFGSVVTLSSTANAGSTFLGWTRDCAGTGTCQLTMDGPHAVRAVFSRSYRPDAWIKLCGLSTGCKIDPLPHPWRGKDVHNTSGRRQTVAVRMEDGEGVRFWTSLQNDGALADTLVVHGCKGNRRFRVSHVTLGKQKRPDAGATEITRKFKEGTAEFSFPPSSHNKRRVFTLNILAPTTAEGVSYSCDITIHSQGDPTARDTVVAKMTTY